MSCSTDPNLEEFFDSIAGPDEDIDLARSALYIARIEYPDLGLVPVLECLDTLASMVSQSTDQQSTGLENVQILLDIVFKEQGLQGTAEASSVEYYDPRNSFINQVLERGVGIPIALSIILISVGTRAGIALGGTSMPMHFLVRVLGVDPPAFVDCYGGGRVLTGKECCMGLHRMTNGRIAFDPEMLALTSNTSILSRMLNNLRLIYFNMNAERKFIATLDMMLMMQPRSSELIRERGYAHWNMGHAGEARHDLEQYLTLSSDSEYRQEIMKMLKEMD
jgi:regulator of sirC expression with transglutaminase-like and TPR domain